MSDPIPPTITPRTAPFWAAAREGRVLIERCRSCSTPRLPVDVACPRCGATDADPVEISGRGRVFASTVIGYRAHPAIADWVPYTVALVDLDEGPRVAGRILDATSRLSAGTAVEPAFVPLDERSAVIAFRVAQ